MRRIIKYIITAFMASFAISTVAKADGGDTTAIKLVKTLDKIEGNRYKITLNSFVTGTEEVTTGSAPVDLVLVLDVSSSMRNNITVKNFNERASADYSFDSYGESTYYYFDGENYYQVHGDNTHVIGEAEYYYLYYENNGNRKYLTGNTTANSYSTDITSQDMVIWTGVLYQRNKKNDYTRINSKDYKYSTYTKELYYKIGSGTKDKDFSKVTRGIGKQVSYGLYYQDGNENKHYLTKNGISDTCPSDITASNQTIWTGVLYSPASTTKSKIAVLKEAVNAFIDEVELRSSETAKHQIGIVVYDGLGGIRKNLTDVTVEGNVDELKEIVEGLTLGSGTCSDLGYDKAKHMLDSLETNDPDRYKESSKVVVMFTDGSPYPGSKRTDGVASSDGVIANAIDISHYLKNHHEAVSYSIGVFGSAPTGNNNLYMHYVTSEYPDAKDINTPGTKNPDGKKYYQESDGSDLTAIFKDIASHTTADSYPLTEKSAAVIDVMSNNFVLPANFSPTKVTVYTKTCVGKVEESKLTDKTANPDGDGYIWNDDRKMVDGKLTVVRDANGNIIGNVAHQFYGDNPTVPVAADGTVEITGFYFAKEDETVDRELIYGNWVGERLDDNGDFVCYAGRKLVVEFEVEYAGLEPGYNVPSNDIASGIYVDSNGDGKITKEDKRVKAYNRPTGDFPALCIVKEGLKPMESAIFTVEGDGKKYTVILTGTGKTYKATDVAVKKGFYSAGDAVPAIAIIRDLEGEKDYTVTETTWSWAYSTDALHPASVINTTTGGVKQTLQDTNLSTEQIAAKWKANDKTDTQKYFIVNDGTMLCYRFVNTPLTKIGDEKTPLHGEDIVTNKFGSNGGVFEKGTVEDEDGWD